eukprot:m.253057 g.253057  ORF g.253057 m.253057 type:complete len:66 (+) comp33905_c0_seq15:4105-4302(+)
MSSKKSPSHHLNICKLDYDFKMFVLVLFLFVLLWSTENIETKIITRKTTSSIAVVAIHVALTSSK